MNPANYNLRSRARTTAFMAAMFMSLTTSRTCFATKEAESKEHAEPPATEASASEMRGIELGEFKIRSDYPAEAQKSTVRFVLYAAVKGDRAAAMGRLIEEHSEKLRDEVITATRLTPLGLFEETDLKTFRRRIFVRLHRTIPELVIDDLYVSDFGLIVKSL